MGNKINKQYSDEEIQFLKENVDKFGIRICAEKLNRSISGAVAKCYEELGYCKYTCKATDDEIDSLIFHDNTKYLLIDFNLTDNPKELAYFLGYFWSDGYISRNKNIILEITKSDADDIEHILIKVASFKTYIRNREGRQVQKTFYYTDYDNKNITRLKSLGKYPKSIESHEKILNYVPECYIEYFLRGLFDGDGCIYVSKTKKRVVQLSLSGRYEQDWGYIISYLKQKYGIDFKIKQSLNGKYKSSCIRSANIGKIIYFLKRIYNEKDDIYLNRKYKKIKELIE